MTNHVSTFIFGSITIAATGCCALVLAAAPPVADSVNVPAGAMAGPTIYLAMSGTAARSPDEPGDARAGHDSDLHCPAGPRAGQRHALSNLRARRLTAAPGCWR